MDAVSKQDREHLFKTGRKRHQVAVTKLWPVTKRLGQVLDYATNPQKTAIEYQSLADVLTYAKDEEKTEKALYVDGINCNVAIAREQFIRVKEQFGKTGGIQAYHGYLSFKEQNISPELAQQIGMEFARNVWGERFQVVVTTHLNTKHLHCHFVINSVSFVDGKRCQDTSWFRFRKVADRICEKHGLFYDPKPNRSKQSDYLSMKEQAGMPTRYLLVREAIDEAISHSRTLQEFGYALQGMGYRYQLSPSRRYWTVVPKGYNKPIRLKNLGEAYTNASITERIKENRNRWQDIQPYHKQAVRPRQYRLPTREHKIKQRGGLYGLYLHYCYKLGYLPRYKKQRPNRLHYLLREDLFKLDQLSEEFRFLGKYRIDTNEQLFAHFEETQKQLKKLTADRTHLRNQFRTKKCELRSDAKDKTEALQEKVRELTKEIGRLRKEGRLCERIKKRSDLLKERLEQIEQDEEKEQGKEERWYEQRR